MGHQKITSRRVAKIASKILRSRRVSKKSKAPAGSALAQSRGKHSRKRKKRT